MVEKPKAKKWPNMEIKFFFGKKPPQISGKGAQKNPKIVFKKIEKPPQGGPQKFPGGGETPPKKEPPSPTKKEPIIPPPGEEKYYLRGKKKLPLPGVS